MMISWKEPHFHSDACWDGFLKHNGVFVNMGCGTKPFRGFVNVDNRDISGIERPNVDARQLTCFEDGSVDYLYASHVLEHLPRADTFRALREWNRVLDVGGMVRISVPDWDATVEYYSRFNDLENIMNWIYGGREHEELNEFTHRRIFNHTSLRVLLYEAGFKRISRYDPKTTFHSNIDDYSSAYMPHMNTKDGIAMSLNVQAWK